MIKKSLFLAACLLMAGGGSAKSILKTAHAPGDFSRRGAVETPVKTAEESPMFQIAGAENLLFGLPMAPKAAAQAPQATPQAAPKADNDPVSWTLPDSVYANKPNGQYALFVYEYDARGNAVRTEFFEKRSASWIPSQRIYAHYNRFDAIDTTINYLFIQGKYVPQACKISVYDTLGHSTKLTNYTWADNLSRWVVSSRYTYTYTPEGRLKTSIKEAIDPSIFELMNSEKMEYAYDAQGRQISFEMTYWQSRKWNPYRAYYLTYEGNKLMKEMGYILSDVSGRYDTTYIFESVYNAQDQRTDYIEHFYNELTEKMEKSLHRTFTYNDKNLVTVEFTQVFDSAVGGMENYSREFFFYNENDQKDSVAYETWRSIEWYHDISYKYTFNQWGSYSGWIYDNFRAEDKRRDKYVFEHDNDGNGILSQAFTLNRKDWIPAERYDLEIYSKDGELILRSDYLKVSEIKAHYTTGTKTPGPLPAEHYTITLSANDEAFGTVSGEGTFTEGIEVTVTATDKEGYRFKEWQENGQVIEGAGAQYTFVLTSNRTLTAVFEEKVSNLNMKLAEAVKVYPNPAANVLHITLNGAAHGASADQACEVELLNLSGRVVEKFRIKAGEKALNVSPYKGTYILRIRQEGAMTVQKIIIL